MSTTTQPQGPEATWPVTAHLDDILATVRPLEPIELQLLDAQGCVLVEDVTVPLSLPPFANSSMDGYALRAADLAGAGEDAPVALRVVGDVAAGLLTPPPAGEGEAVRIMTGAPLPEGADTVVPVEWTDGGLGGGPVDRMTPHSTAPEGASGTVRVFRPAEPGAHVREAGSDVREGDLALAAGTVLGPPQLGLLAAVGRDTVRVRPRPRVVVLATGSELVQPGESLAPGQIHDSNSFTLTAAARDAGALAFRVGAIGDDAETLRATIEDQLIRADLVVTSGGVSVGAYDVVKEALTDWTGLPEPAAEGEDADTGENSPAQETEGPGAPRGVVFRKLAMQPGKPQGFGTIGRDATPVLALPGNPVSAYVSFELFVRPAIRALAGLADLHRPTVRALVEAPKALTSPAGRRQYLRARHADGRVTPVGGASSHLVGALARANALLVVPEERTSVEPGEEVEVVLLG
ncbi:MULTISPECIES: gephyrin-like molybdotransferase Glp [Streptomyces]|uniref:Molybdopterin molybdenumtransferase n=2 Tax=Streptomyces TaxID=1883 RepID=A0ABU2RDC2_9ACTN|nr:MULTISPECIES: gephyrin-like molybdotransferase Glp [unclassified Streptomyces]MDT0413339.1 molybdopterin molybdotransferase MoeA [Streptomyces sp. DSM 41979]MYQ55864.1 molybdopterin molybdenumtransferase MoeA [Streptomyces sp. SID4926]